MSRPTLLNSRIGLLDGDARYDVAHRIASVTALLADTSGARGAGTTWYAASHQYTEAASSASDHHVTTAGGVKLYVQPKNGAVSLDAFGVVAGGADIKAFLDIAVTAAKRVVIPASPLGLAWNLATTWTGDGPHIDFEKGAKVNCTMTATLAMDLTNTKLTNGYFTSPYSAAITSANQSNYRETLDAYARSIRLHDNCIVEDHYQEYACAGLDMRGANIRVKNVFFYHLRHYKGWAAALHAPGTASTNIRIDGVKIDSCDRGCEFESGCTDIWADNVSFRNVFPVGYTGQPSDFANYTFVASAHSHTGEGPCVNIRFRNLKIENCGGGVLFVRSNGTDDNDLPRNCSAENVEVIGNADLPGAYPMFGLMGHSCGIKGLVIRPGAGITSLMRIQFYAGPSDDCYVEDIRAEAYTLPLVTVDNQHTGAKIRKVRPLAGGILSGASGYLFDLSGANVRLSDCDAISVTGTNGYINLGSTATRAKVKNNDLTVATGETFTAVITSGAVQAQIQGNTISNNATAPPIDIQMRNTAASFIVTDNNFDRGAGTSVQLVGGSTNGVITHNLFGNAAATIDDLTSGGGHVIERNKTPGAAGWSDPNSKAAVTDVITVNGTNWVKRTGATAVTILLIPGGSGGGSGRRGAAGTVRCGGGGGGSPSPSIFTLPASVLPANQAVNIGAGGAGGAAVTTDDTNGNPGTAGGFTAFGNLFARPGGAGAGGTNATGTGGAAGSGGTFANSGAGGAASVSGGAGGGAGSGGGGAGAGLTTGNAAAAGGAGGGATNGFGGVTAAAAGAAGTGSGGQAGAAGAAPTLPTNYGVGLGGAGGGSDPTSVGGAGGAGGGYGAPGGGGAASVNGQASGKGGDGSPGVAIITTYF